MSEGEREREDQDGMEEFLYQEKEDPLGWEEEAGRYQSAASTDKYSSLFSMEGNENMGAEISFI